MPTGFASDVIDALGALRGTARDIVERRGDPLWHETLLAELGTTPRALLSTVPWLLRAREGRDESFVRLLGEHARRDPDALAVEMGDEQLTWSELDQKTSDVAHLLASHGVRAGDVGTGLARALDHTCGERDEFVDLFLSHAGPKLTADPRRKQYRSAAPSLRRLLLASLARALRALVFQFRRAARLALRSHESVKPTPNASTRIIHKSA